MNWRNVSMRSIVPPFVAVVVIRAVAFDHPTLSESDAFVASGAKTKLGDDHVTSKRIRVV